MAPQLSSFLFFLHFVPLQFDFFIFDQIQDLIDQGTEFVIDVSDLLFDELKEQITTTDYPSNNDGTPILFPESEDLEGVFAVMGELHADVIREAVITLVFIALIFHALFRVMGMVFEAGKEDYDPNQQIRVCIKAVILTVFWWPIGVLLLVSSELLAEVFLSFGDSVNELNPDSEYSQFGGIVDLLRTNVDNLLGAGGNIAAIASLILVLVPMALNLSLMLVLLLLWQVRLILIYLLLPAYPLVYVFKAYKFPYLTFLGSIGDGVTKVFINLVYLTIPAAALIQFYGIAAAAAASVNNVGESSETGMMVLANGAVANSTDPSIAVLILSALLLIALLVSFPLVIAGAPFGVLYVSVSGKKSLSGIVEGATNPAAAVSGFASGAVPGSNSFESKSAVASKGQGIKDSFSSGVSGAFASDEEESESDGSSSGEASGSSSGSATEESSSNSAAETATKSRMQRVKDQASGLKESYDSGSMMEDAAGAAGAFAGGSAVKAQENAPTKDGIRSTLGSAKDKVTDTVEGGVKHAYMAKENPEAYSQATRRSAVNMTKNGRARAKEATNELDETIDKLGQKGINSIDQASEELYHKNRDRISNALQEPDMITEAREDAKDMDAQEVVEKTERFSETPQAVKDMQERKERLEQERDESISIRNERVAQVESILKDKYTGEELEERIGVNLHEESLMGRKNMPITQMMDMVDSEDVVVPTEYFDRNPTAGDPITEEEIEKAKQKYLDDNLDSSELGNQVNQLSGERITVTDADHITPDQMQEFIANSDYEPKDLSQMRQEKFIEEYEQVTGEEFAMHNREEIIAQLAEEEGITENTANEMKARHALQEAKKEDQKAAGARTRAENAVDEEVLKYFEGGETNKTLEESLNWLDSDSRNKNELSDGASALFDQVLDEEGENIDSDEFINRVYETDLSDSPVSDDTTMREEDIMRIKQAAHERKTTPEKAREVFSDSILSKRFGSSESGSETAGEAEKAQKEREEIEV